MAGAGRKVFTRGTLSSADVNGYLMEQAVMVFASSAARLVALPAPDEGMHSYLLDTKRREVRQGGAWVTPEALGKIDGSSTTTQYNGPGTTVETRIAGGLNRNPALYPGRVYRVLLSGRVNTDTAGVALSIQIRTRRSSLGTVLNTDPVVATHRTYMGVIGGTGQNDVKVNGTFSVPAADTWTLSPFQLTTGGTSALMNDGRGIVDVIVTDEGPGAGAVALT